MRGKRTEDLIWNGSPEAPRFARASVKIIFDNRYISALLALKQFPEIIELAKKRIKLDPGNLEHRITLTAAYLQAGRRQEAIQTLEEIIKLDPTFKEKGDYYISEIKAGRNP